MPNTKRYLQPEFRTDTPLLEANILEEWGYWDGPLYGVCEVNGEKLFFVDIIESIWRHFSSNDSQRLWRIYAVYNLDLEYVKSLMANQYRQTWQQKIEDEASPIGIFWG